MNGKKIEMMHPLKSDKRGASKIFQNFGVDKLELLFYYIAKQMYYKGVGAVNEENMEMYLALSDEETTMQEIRNQIQDLFLRLGPDSRRKPFILFSPCLKLCQKKQLLIGGQLVHQRHKALCGFVEPALGSGGGFRFPCGSGVAGATQQVVGGNLKIVGDLGDDLTAGDSVTPFPIKKGTFIQSEIDKKFVFCNSFGMN